MSICQLGNKFYKLALDGLSKEVALKFCKGKALLENGQRFSGSVMSMDSNGITLLREYEDGFLKTAIKSKRAEEISRKNYFYNFEGKLTKVTDSNKKPIMEVIPIEDANVVKNSHNLYFTDKTNGKLCGFDKNNQSSKDIVIKEDLARDIPEYPNQSVIAKLNKVRNSNDTLKEKINQILQIFLEETKLTTNNIKFTNHKFNGVYLAGADRIEPAIYYDEQCLAQYPIEMIISTFRHEIDHIVKYLKLAKTIGVENYKNAAIKTIPEPQKRMIERNFPIYDWQKSIKGIDATDFDSIKYKEALETYPEYYKRCFPKDIVNFDRKYFNNALESSALDKENSILRSLGVIDIETLATYKLSQMIEQEVVRLTKTLKDSNKADAQIDKIISEVIPQNRNENSYLYQILQTLRNTKSLT